MLKTSVPAPFFTSFLHPPPPHALHPFYSYILQEQLDIAKLLGVSGVKQQTTSVAPAVTGAVSWRREGLKYKKNEVSGASKRLLSCCENVTV